MLDEVIPGVFRISQNKRTRFARFSVNVFVLAGENGLVFDAGMGGDTWGAYLVSQIKEIEGLMEKRGEPCRIRYVMPSHGHWDHFSGVAYLRKHLGLKVLISPAMHESICSRVSYRKSFRKETEVINAPCPWLLRRIFSLAHFLQDALFFRVFKVTFVPAPFEPVSDHDVFPIGGNLWELLMMPGHCDDDMVLINREKGVVLSGDIVLRSVNTWIGPPRSNLERYMKTLEDLSGIPGLTLILPAHGSSVTEPYKRLKEALEHRLKRIREVEDMIKNSGPSGINFEKIFKTIYPSVSYKEKLLARGWILLTLWYLLDRKTVRAATQGRTKWFFGCDREGLPGPDQNEDRN